ncbi:MAG: signal peptidase II [Roseinatronobacter sp.]
MRIAIGTGTVALILDQASKWWVIERMALDQRLFIPVLDPYLNFAMAWNRGVNFGLFASYSEVMRWVLVALAVAICAFVWIWVRREGAERWMQIGAGFLIGGALGNVIDRVRWGAVADFLNMSCCGLHNPFAFNIADAAIFLGAGILIFASGRKPAAD